MGLDMYLEGSQFISEYSDKELLDNLSPFFNKEIGEIKRVNFEVMYWRKANAIHKWFVDNVQEGKDDCGTYYVTDAVLTNLKDDIKQVLDNKTVADKVLPTQGGFFFGSTDIDDYYIETMQKTYDRLEFILNNKEIFKSIDFHYTSSW